MKIVYIDVQNVHRRITDRWWVLDWQKFYAYLKDHLSPDIIIFAVGYLTTNKDFYQQLCSYGYTMLYKEVILKPDGSIKWNVDIDIALRAAFDICEEWLAIAHVVTNDGDYNSLLKSCKERGVLWHLIVPDASKASKLLVNLISHLIDIQDIRHHVEKTKGPI